MKLDHGLDDGQVERIRGDTARQMRAFELPEASLAARLPAALKPRIPELAQGLCKDLAEQGYFFIPLEPE